MLRVAVDINGRPIETLTAVNSGVVEGGTATERRYEWRRFGTGDSGMLVHDRENGAIELVRAICEAALSAEA